MGQNKSRLTILARIVFAVAYLVAATPILSPATMHGDHSSRSSRKERRAAQGGASQTGNADQASVQQFNANQVAALKKQIAGKEDQPAGGVFKNVKMFKEVPAGALLRIMQFGYSPALGVKCTHCHVADDYASDSKPEKQIAREMNAMAQTINGSLLKNIANLRGPNPIVNCTTCHRGEVKPALTMPASGAH